MKVALVVGHKKESPGARCEETNVNEFEFNMNLAKKIKETHEFRYSSAKSIETFGKLDDIVIVYRDSYKGLPSKINALEPDYIVSLHCNAFNKKASGTETLYYHSSSKSKHIAEIYQKRTVEALGLTDRGLKPTHTEDRGGYLLRYTNASCVLVEPFFIDNLSDFQAATPISKLVNAHIVAMEEVREFLK